MDIIAKKQKGKLQWEANNLNENIPGSLLNRFEIARKRNHK